MVCLVEPQPSEITACEEAVAYKLLGLAGCRSGPGFQVETREEEPGSSPIPKLRANLKARPKCPSA